MADDIRRYILYFELFTKKQHHPDWMVLRIFVSRP